MRRRRRDRHRATARPAAVDGRLPAAPLDDAAALPTRRPSRTARPAWARGRASLAGACSRRCRRRTTPTASSPPSSAAAERAHRGRTARRAARSTMHRGAARRAERVLQHRHHLFDQLGGSVRELTASLTDLAENDSWVKGQCDAMRAKIDEGLTRARRALGQRLLRHTRERQARAARRARAGARCAQGPDQPDARRTRRTGLADRSLPRERRPLRRGDREGRFAREPDRRGARDGRRRAAACRRWCSRRRRACRTSTARRTGLSERVIELESEMRRLSTRSRPTS